MAESVVIESAEESELDVLHELLVDVSEVVITYLLVFTCKLPPAIPHSCKGITSRFACYDTYHIFRSSLFGIF